jgi:hypothetical protein
MLITVLSASDLPALLGFGVASSLNDREEDASCSARYCRIGQMLLFGRLSRRVSLLADLMRLHTPGFVWLCHHGKQQEWVSC